MFSGQNTRFALVNTHLLIETVRNRTLSHTPTIYHYSSGVPSSVNICLLPNRLYIWRLHFLISGAYLVPVRQITFALKMQQQGSSCAVSDHPSLFFESRAIGDFWVWGENTQRFSCSAILPSSMSYYMRNYNKETEGSCGHLFYCCIFWTFSKGMACIPHSNFKLGCTCIHACV